MICLFGRGSDERIDPANKPFAKALAKHGLVDGENIEIEIVFNKSPWITHDAEWEEGARRVVASRPDVIVVHMTWLDFFKRLTRDIPIVFMSSIDTERHGGIAKPNRPGGNVTGVAILFLELQRKRFELLKELRPRARRLAVVHSDGGEYNEMVEGNVKSAALRLGLEGVSFPLPDNSETLLPVLQKARIELVDFLWYPERPQIYEGLIELGIASSFPVASDFVRAGGLLSYSPKGTGAIVAEIVARILRGEKVGTIPAQQPREFHFALNLRTARRLGITVPESILLRVNELVE